MCLAVPGRILSISGDDPVMRTGSVSFGGVIKEVNLAFVPHASVGDYVIVHAGFALNTIDEKEAEQTFEHLRELDRLNRNRGRST
jgi:hydrogenase expression/formation protein HypC